MAKVESQDSTITDLNNQLQRIRPDLSDLQRKLESSESKYQTLAEQKEKLVSTK